ncbi:histidine phosphatase family protein [bacterium]|jgi:phosphohistidine phosphatase|nr:histidine phosphatase family protein [bacterium]
MAKNEKGMSTGQCRRLILMRHAKSDWGDKSLADHDRPLNRRGMEDTPLMAQWIAENDLLPDQILCSSAERTRETVELLLQAWSANPDWSLVESLYLATPHTIVSTIRSVFSGSETLMVVAHNPGITYLASMLAGKGIDMPTAAIAVFQVTNAEWCELDSETPLQLTHFMRPKAL